MFISLTIILFLIIHIIIHSHPVLALRKRKPAIYSKQQAERFKMAARITLVPIELLFSLYTACLLLNISTTNLFDLNAFWMILLVFVVSFTLPVQFIAEEKHTALFFESNLTNTRWQVHLVKVDAHFSRKHYQELSEILAIGLQTNIDYIELSSPMFQRNNQNRNITRLDKVAKHFNYRISHVQNDNWIYHLLAALKLLVIKNTQKRSPLRHLNPMQWRTIRLSPTNV